MQSELLDVVIGVVFTWFLLSTVLSALHEGFALATHARAKHLWIGIGRLIDPKKTKLPRRLLDVGFALPFRGTLDLRPRAQVETPVVVAGRAADATATPRPTGRVSTSRAEWTSRPDRKVSGELFDVRREVQKIYDALGPNLVEVAKPGRLSKTAHVASTAISDAVVRLAGNVFKQDLVDTVGEMDWPTAKRTAVRGVLAAADLPADKPLELDDLATMLPADGPPSEEDMRWLYQHAAARLTGRDVATLFEGNPELVRAVNRAAAAVAADDRVVAVRKTVEAWFEREMDQLSAFYRRQTRKILAILAVPLVLFCHANAIELFESLRQDQSLREAVASAAVSATAGQQDAICEDPASAGGSTTTTTASTTTTDKVDAAAARFTCARDVLDRATDFRVGLAWQEIKEASGNKGKAARFKLKDIPAYLGDVLTERTGVVGRAITLVALLFGAQFWFDVLRRLVGLRTHLSGQAPAG